MMLAVDASETWVNVNKSAWPYISEGCNLHTRRRENLKCHIFSISFLRTEVLVSLSCRCRTVEIVGSRCVVFC